MKKQVIISFILGAIIFGGVGTILAYKLGANQVSYTPNDQTWNVSEVDTALDDLYDMATYGNATSSDIRSGKTALVNGNQVTGTLDASSISGFDTTTITVPKNTNTWTVPTDGMASYVIFYTYNTSYTSNKYYGVAEPNSNTTSSLWNLTSLSLNVEFTDEGVIFSGGALSGSNTYSFNTIVIY